MSRVSPLVTRRMTALIMALHLLVLIACAQASKPAAEPNEKNPSNSSPAHYEIKPDSFRRLTPRRTRSTCRSLSRCRRAQRSPSLPVLRLPSMPKAISKSRAVALAPNGDVFVAESRAGRITILRDANKDGTPEQRLVFATGLTQPFGMAFGETIFTSRIQTRWCDSNTSRGRRKPRARLRRSPICPARVIASTGLAISLSAPTGRRCTSA